MSAKQNKVAHLAGQEEHFEGGTNAVSSYMSMDMID
jgi:hypothetical protein